MKKQKSEKVMQVLGLFFLAGMVAFSVSLPVFSQSRNSSGAKKSSTSSKSSSVKRKGSSASKSSKVRKQTNSSSKKTRSLSSAKRAATSSTKRAATSSVRASTRRNATRVRRTIGNNLSFLNQLNDNSTVEEQTCIERYVSCMDEQISSTIANYSFLTEDEALNAALDTGQPFRCAFYDNASTTLVSNSDLLKDDKSICINSDVSNCYTQRGINELYSSYNYYCSINRKLKNNIGRKINQCDLAHSSSFATKYSTAYYNEVLNRINGDGLQMINLENSTIYKNFINQLHLQNVDSYVINSDISNEIFSELNLETETELFSINVVPPIGANNYLASSQFNKASNKCFIKEELAGTAAQKKSIKEKNENASYLQTNCSSLKSNLERYYLTGKWTGIPLDENGNSVGTDTTDIETGFFSAKDSCNLYEQALISVRDSKYGEFDNQMQNWIESNLTKIIQKKIKSTASLSTATTSLLALDQQISANNEKIAREISYSKKKAENDLIAANNKISMAKNEAATKKNEANREFAKLYADNFSTKIVSACTDMVSDAYKSVCGNKGSSCFSSSVGTTFHTLLSQIPERTVKISKDGDLVRSHTSNSPTSGYENYVIDSEDKTKKTGYYTVYCKDVKGFNSTLSPFISMINDAKAKSEAIGDEVKRTLEQQFPG